MRQNEEERRRRANEVMNPFTAEEFIRFCVRYYTERFNSAFIFDDKNKMLIDKLSQYFTGDERFLEGGYSFDKGILIMGNVGVGKTEIMKFMQKNKKSCFKIVSCNDVSNEFLLYAGDKDNQGTIENIYSTPIEKALNDPSVFYQRKIGFCFDDLGTEEIKNSFGNKKNVMADVIMAIYNKRDFSRFHITTNLTGEEIENRYGTRVISRIREMFNVFVLEGNDRRK